MLKISKLYCLLFLIILLTCSKQDIKPIEKNRIMMGTFVKIVVYDNDKSDFEIDKIIDQAFDAIRQIDSLSSNWSDSSLVALINTEADKHPIGIDSNFADIIKLSLQISDISHGAFDITIAPVMEKWDFKSGKSDVPNEELIKKMLPLVNYKNIVLDDQSLKFLTKEMKIDLSGISKGYAVDAGMETLKKLGIKDALINAGGDIRAICSSLTTGKRKFWIQHPRKQRSLYAYFKSDNACVATSGDYENYFMVDSVRYHHILDPKTGFPARGCVSVTIITDTAAKADALATAVFVLGPQNGMQLINNLDGVEGVIIFKQDGGLKHTISKGLKSKVHIVEN